MTHQPRPTVSAAARDRAPSSDDSLACMRRCASAILLTARYNDASSPDSDSIKLLREWPQRLKSITDEVTEYEVRGKAIEGENYRRLASPPEDPEDRRAHLQELGRAAGAS